MVVRLPRRTSTGTGLFVNRLAPARLPRDIARSRSVLGDHIAAVLDFFDSVLRREFAARVQALAWGEIGLSCWRLPTLLLVLALGRIQVEHDVESHSPDPSQDFVRDYESPLTITRRETTEDFKGAILRELPEAPSMSLQERKKGREVLLQRLRRSNTRFENPGRQLSNSRAGSALADRIPPVQRRRGSRL